MSRSGNPITEHRPVSCCFRFYFRALPPASASPTFALGVSNVPCNAEMRFHFSFRALPPASTRPMFAK